MIKDFILLIPCYNNYDGLLKSVKSIHYPTDKYEVLIVDDGSTESISTSNVKSVFPGLTFQIIRVANNQGIVHALNTGLEQLKARNDFKFIARLDAGDVCHPERFTKQVGFLNTHSDVFLLGSWCRFENPLTKKGFDYITKTEHNDILKEMHFKCSFIHPTVMLKKEVLPSIGFYPADYPHAEDYAFFWSIVKKHKGAILPEKLVSIEWSQNTVSSGNYKQQLRSREKITKKLGTISSLKFLGILLLKLKILLPKLITHGIKNVILRSNF